MIFSKIGPLGHNFMVQKEHEEGGSNYDTQSHSCQTVQYLDNRVRFLYLSSLINMEEIMHAGNYDFIKLS